MISGANNIRSLCKRRRTAPEETAGRWLSCFLETCGWLLSRADQSTPAARNFERTTLITQSIPPPPQPRNGGCSHCDPPRQTSWWHNPRVELSKMAFRFHEMFAEEETKWKHCAFLQVCHWDFFPPPPPLLWFLNSWPATTLGTAWI